MVLGDGLLRMQTSSASLVHPFPCLHSLYSTHLSLIILYKRVPFTLHHFPLAVVHAYLAHDDWTTKSSLPPSRHPAVPRALATAGQPCGNADQGHSCSAIPSTGRLPSREE